VVAQTFTSGRHIRDRHALYLHDEPQIEISSRQPLPAEMDGEYLGDRDRLLVECVPDALSLVY
jgi:diacylglycerol kinase family enzyme